MAISSRIIATVATLLALTAPLIAQDATTGTEATGPVAETETEAASLPEMAEIEQAWTRGDFVFVRDGLERLARETGTALAQYRYGRVLIEGRGGPVDAVAAEHWLNLAAQQNHLEAATLLARLLLTGAGPEVPRDPERAAQLLTRAAARGDAEAQYYLGLLSEAGTGTAQDPEAAFNWFLAAAEQGHVAAQYELSKLYSRGIGTELNTPEALRWLQEAASSGHAEAQLFLALAYDRGQGVAADPNEALRWYRRAAEAGSPLAQRILGTHYLTGTLVAVDPVEAQRWLELAAEAGDPGAMFNLGMALLSGEVLAGDVQRAFGMIDRAAQTGLIRARAVLAQLYENGIGVTADPDRALALYREAAEGGSDDAQIWLARGMIDGTLEGKFAPQRGVPWVVTAVRAEEEGALDWLTARAEAGLPAAQAALGHLLLDDPERQAEATAMLIRAAEAGVLSAQVLLGQAYSTGDHGLAQDYVAAHAWLNIAAAAGDAASGETRDVIAALMTPDQIAEAQATTRAFYAAEAARVPRTEQTVVTGQSVTGQSVTGQ